MLYSKKQQWILEMIKGPDIVPAGDSPGQYSPKNAFEIVAEGQRFRISPADVLDLADPDRLVVASEDGGFKLSWQAIDKLDFKEPRADTTPVLQPDYHKSRHRIFPSPLGKKIG